MHLKYSMHFINPAIHVFLKTGVRGYSQHFSAAIRILSCFSVVDKLFEFWLCALKKTLAVQLYWKAILWEVNERSNLPFNMLLES